jgi:hypothetical protein
VLREASVVIDAAPAPMVDAAPVPFIDAQPLAQQQPPGAVERVEDAQRANDAAKPFDETPPAGLNAQQRVLFQQVLEWANDDTLHRMSPHRHAAPEPIRMLIDGAAGVGKSWLVRSLCSRLAQPRHAAVVFGVLNVAPTGVAAANLPEGRTIHSALGISVTKRLRDDATTLANVCRLLERTHLMVIDEVSMISSDLLELIDARLTRHCAAGAGVSGDAGFGGFGVILMGDFFQIAAIGESLGEKSSAVCLV